VTRQQEESNKYGGSAYVGIAGKFLPGYNATSWKRALFTVISVKNRKFMKY
jgi:hypothetical protein